MEANTGLVVDLEVLSNTCSKACAQKQSNLTTEAFEEWKLTTSHKCTRNHTGSASSMESKAAKTLFQCELDKGFRYTELVGDGDSFAFKSIKTIYGPDHLVTKYECCNHDGKRLGARMRKMKNELSVPVPTRGGTIRRSMLAGVLRNEDITSLSKFDKKALKENVKTSTEQMRKSIMATFYHHASSDANPQHDLCPEGPQSWCFFNRAIADGRGSKNHVEQKLFFRDLSNVTVAQIKGIYEDLTSDEILTQCQGIHKTQMNQFIQKSGKSVQRINMQGITVYCFFAELLLWTTILATREVVLSSI